jgi:hypothetical protein
MFYLNMQPIWDLTGFLDLPPPGVLNIHGVVPGGKMSVLYCAAQTKRNNTSLAACSLNAAGIWSTPGRASALGSSHSRTWRSLQICPEHNSNARQKSPESDRFQGAESSEREMKLRVCYKISITFLINYSLIG